MLSDERFDGDGTAFDHVQRDTAAGEQAHSDERFVSHSIMGIVRRPPCHTTAVR